ncbi:MAG: SDR family NAD(P)-dependent oxidoreductase [Cardiobacteriaceae bacterium]|nr:SDR family NAD(P)-dependent oxidoreductase [Cardiobacteriaceae bacterium]
MSEHVIITGHSRGLGAALANAWLDLDATVFGVARHGNAALKAAYPAHFQEMLADLADVDALMHVARSNAFREFCRESKRLWLFNNAGTVQPASVLGEQDADAIVQAVHLNILAPILLANAVVAAAGAKTQVNIVHIGSGAAATAYPGWSIYGASKAALKQHARVGLMENTQTRIVCIAPGVVDTAMQAEIRNDAGFPLRDRFQHLHDSGTLQDADDTAIKIVSYCLSHEFGQEAAVDVRQILGS